MFILIVKVVERVKGSAYEHDDGRTQDKLCNAAGKLLHAPKESAKHRHCDQKADCKGIEFIEIRNPYTQKQEQDRERNHNPAKKEYFRLRQQTGQASHKWNALTSLYKKSLRNEQI